jgi:hypothetical protein
MMTLSKAILLDGDLGFSLNPKSIMAVVWLLDNHG